MLIVSSEQGDGLRLLRFISSLIVCVLHMTPTEIKKQISIFLPISSWRALHLEAARQQIPITELCRRWIIPEIEKLPRSTFHRETASWEGTQGRR